MKGINKVVTRYRNAIILLKIFIVVFVILFICFLGYGIVKLIKAPEDVVVQIANGSIYEHDTEEDSDSKSVDLIDVEKGTLEYRKAKMLYQYLSSNPSESSKLIRALPATMSKILPDWFTPNNILELYILYNEQLETVGTNENYKTLFSIETLYGTFKQEQYFGSNYDRTSLNFFTAWQYNDSREGSYVGPYQMHRSYFNQGNYKYYISKYENPNLEDFERFGTNTMISNSNISLSNSLRIGASENSRSYFFPDLTCWTVMSWASACSRRYNDIEKLASFYGIDEVGKEFLYNVVADYTHRGADFSSMGLSSAISSDGSLKNPSKTWLLAFYVEIASNGLLDELSNLNLNSRNEMLEQIYGSSNSLAYKAQEINKCKFNLTWVGKTAKDSGVSSPELNPEYHISTFMRYASGIICVEETEFLINQWFGVLGLTIGSKGANLELTENQGEFQGYWTDSNGKLLNSNDMREYIQEFDLKSQNELSNMLKWVGLSNRKKTAIFSVDRYNVYNDGIGFIHYRQSEISNDGDDYNKLHQNVKSFFADGVEWKFGDSFCGGFSTAMVMSTYYHKYVHPTEVAIAANTYNSRHNANEPMMWRGILTYEGIKSLFEEQMYGGSPMFKLTRFDKMGEHREEVTDIIKNGGMAILIVGASSGLTKGGHYIVVREVTESNKFLLGNSTWSSGVRSPDKEWSWDELVDGTDLKSNQYILMIEPNEGLYKYYEDSSLEEFKPNDSEDSEQSNSDKEITEVSLEILKEFYESNNKWGQNPIKIKGISSNILLTDKGFVGAILYRFGYKDMLHLNFEEWKSGDSKYSLFEDCEVITKFNKIKSGDILVLDSGSYKSIMIYVGDKKVYSIDGEDSRKQYDSELSPLNKKEEWSYIKSSFLKAYRIK